MKRRNLIVLALAAAAFALASLAWAIISRIKRKNSNELVRFIEDCQNATADARRKILAVKMKSEQVSAQTEKLAAMLVQLEQTRGKNYDRLQRDHQEKILVLLHGTLGLAKLLNMKASES